MLATDLDGDAPNVVVPSETSERLASALHRLRGFVLVRCVPIEISAPEGNWKSAIGAAPSFPPEELQPKSPRFVPIYSEHL